MTAQAYFVIPKRLTSAQKAVIERVSREFCEDYGLQYVGLEKDSYTREYYARFICNGELDNFNIVKCCGCDSTICYAVSVGGCWVTDCGNYGDDDDTDYRS